MNLDPKISETIIWHHAFHASWGVWVTTEVKFCTSFFSPASARYFVVGLKYSPNLTSMTWFDLEDIDLGQW